MTPGRNKQTVIFLYEQNKKNILIILGLKCHHITTNTLAPAAPVEIQSSIENCLLVNT